MQKVRQIWEETAKQLEKVYDQREAQTIAYYLLEDMFQVKKASILANEAQHIDEQELALLVERLQHHEPIQYVTGRADFYGRRFTVKPGVLIPRPETEELVHAIVQNNPKGKPKILEVGVGSGCLAITLALETQGTIVGTDVSPEALAIAKQNARDHQVTISFFEHDVLTSDLPEHALDVLVSNPPYIPLDDQKEMSRNVLGYEPSIALFVPDDDPMVFYRRISELGLQSLKEGGEIYFEIHERLGEQVCQTLVQQGYKDVKIIKDMQGKDRVAYGYKLSQ